MVLIQQFAILQFLGTCSQPPKREISSLKNYSRVGLSETTYNSLQLQYLRRKSNISKKIYHAKRKYGLGISRDYEHQNMYSWPAKLIN